MPQRRGHQRRYSDDDLRWLGCIREINHRGGVTLAGIRGLLCYLPCWALRGCAMRAVHDVSPAKFDCGSAATAVQRLLDGQAPTPTAGPTSTPLPTATPLTQAGFNESYRNTIDQLAVDGLSEAEWRQLYEGDILRQRLLDEITADVPHTQEQVWARHILVSEESIAVAVRVRLDKGEDFAAVAAEVSTDTSNKDRGGDLGWFGKGAMVPEFETAAFTLPIGEISEPVKTQFGWHIVQVLARGEVALTAEAYESARQTAFGRPGSRKPAPSTTLSHMIRGNLSFLTILPHRVAAQ